MDPLDSKQGEEEMFVSSEAISQDETVPSISNLEFKDFGDSQQLHAHDAHSEEDEMERLIKKEETGGEEAKPESKYSVGFFRSLFDVDTSVVVHRVLWALWPFRGDNVPPFLDPEDQNQNADLYGPFWIATTLVFLMGVSGNLASYVVWRSNVALDVSGHGPWSYDFNKVTLAAILVYGYVFIMPLLVWLVLKRASQSVKLIVVYCEWGYAMTPFLPASILCIINSEAWRWVIVILAGAVSYTFLAQQYRKRVDAAKWPPVLGGIFFLHAGVTLVLKLYFFDFSKSTV